MKAVGYLERGLPITDEKALLDLDLPDPPPPAGWDLLVRVHAVSVNPRDVKSRQVLELRPGQAGRPRLRRVRHRGSHRPRGDAVPAEGRGVLRRRPGPPGL